MGIKYFRDYPQTEEVYLHIRGIGIREIMPPGLVDRPRGTADYLFMYFYNPVLIQAKGRNLESQKKCCIIWTPDANHYFGNQKQAWNHTWMHCQGKLVPNLLERHNISCNTVLLMENASIFEKYLFGLSP